VYALQRYAFLVLFPVNPTTLAKYRQTFHVWVALSISHCFWAKAYYEQQRSRRASHQAALRALAFKWIRIAFRCWHDRTPYDEATYLSALKRRGSPLVN
jgi:hypothetical protein